MAANGLETDALDMTLGYGLRDLFRKIDEMKPDIIGFTVMTYQYHHTLSIVAAVKSRYPDISLIIGGAHVSAVGVEAMRQCPSADYGVHGEGEIPMRDLCQGSPLERIAGLYYRENGQIRTGPPSQ